MVAAYRSNPAGVSRFYADDASIVGSGRSWTGRGQIDRYWSGSPPGEWTLEVREVGGSSDAPWVRGRSTLVPRNGRATVVEYLGILKRGPDRRLRFYVDMYVPARNGTS